MSRSSWFLGLMRKRASPCWLQLCTLGSYHPRPLRDAHSSHRILRVRRAPRQSLRSVPTNIKHTSQHLKDVSAAAGAPGTDAAADALAAVGVNCSSSSSELSACSLGSSTFRTVSSLLYSLPSLTETTCLLLTYVLTLCVNAVDDIVAASPSNNTRITFNAA